MEIFGLKNEFDEKIGKLENLEKSMQNLKIKKQKLMTKQNLLDKQEEFLSKISKRNIEDSIKKRFKKFLNEKKESLPKDINYLFDNKKLRQKIENSKK